VEEVAADSGEIDVVGMHTNDARTATGNDFACHGKDECGQAGDGEEAEPGGGGVGSAQRDTDENGDDDDDHKGDGDAVGEGADLFVTAAKANAEVHGFYCPLRSKGFDGGEAEVDEREFGGLIAEDTVVGECCFEGGDEESAALHGWGVKDGALQPGVSEHWRTIGHRAPLVHSTSEVFACSRDSGGDGR
jgi:hypothetical protein